jgi:predicted Zn-ribbon and HTH transcriptional regulator
MDTELITLTKPGYSCKKCGYKWFARIKNRTPSICPKCMNHKWYIDKPMVVVTLETKDIN